MSPRSPSSGCSVTSPSFLSSLQGDLSVRTVRGGAAARPEEEPRPGAHSRRTQAGGWLQQQDGRRYHSLTHFVHAPFLTLATVVLRWAAGAQNCVRTMRPSLWSESSRVNVTAATAWQQVVLLREARTWDSQLQRDAPTAGGDRIVRQQCRRLTERERQVLPFRPAAGAAASARQESWKYWLTITLTLAASALT